MTVVNPSRRITPAEYYRLGQESTYKSNFYNGEIFSTAGDSEAHSLICANLIGELSTALKGRPCAVYDPNMRLLVKATGLRVRAASLFPLLNPDTLNPYGVDDVTPQIDFLDLSHPVS